MFLIDISQTFADNKFDPINNTRRAKENYQCEVVLDLKEGWYLQQRSQMITVLKGSTMPDESKLVL